MSQFVVLGDPVGTSLSPVIQQAAFDYAGIEGTYGARQVDDDGMAQAIDEIRSGRLAGANVTMPHKRLAVSLADRIVGDAARMSAANTLWREGDQAVAASTDPDGIQFAWRQAELPMDTPVLILGAGGAAAAAVVGLEDRLVAVSARSQEAGEQLLATLGSDAWLVPWGIGVPDAVVVNATPLGMKGEPLPDAVLDEASGLLEMTYGTEPSPAAVALERRLLPVAGGELMLVGQGAASFEIWTGVSVPHQVMLDAIDRFRGTGTSP